MDTTNCMDCGRITTNPSGWCDSCGEDAHVLDIERARDDFLLRSDEELAR